MVEELVKKYNSLSEQHDELEHLKNNMNEYLGRDKAKLKKESVIGTIKKHKEQEKGKTKKEKDILKEVER